MTCLTILASGPRGTEEKKKRKKAPVRATIDGKAVLAPPCPCAWAGSHAGMIYPSVRLNVIHGLSQIRPSFRLKQNITENGVITLRKVTKFYNFIEKGIDTGSPLSHAGMTVPHICTAATPGQPWDNIIAWESTKSQWSDEHLSSSSGTDRHCSAQHGVYNSFTRAGGARSSAAI